MPPSPLWKLEVEEEAKFYFLDNDPYTFELLAEIIRLSYYVDPLEGCTEMTDEPGVFVLALFDHRVYFTFAEGLIQILVVKPD